MQRTETVSASHVHRVIEAAFANGRPVAYEAYSRADNAARSFANAEAVIAHIQSEREHTPGSILLALYYPGTLGAVKTTTINLEPEKCGGATWRQTVEGWGLIQLQIRYKTVGIAECRIAVNSEKRANAWAETYPDFGAPSLWDWKLVEKHARRLILVLRSDA